MLDSGAVEAYGCDKSRVLGELEKPNSIRSVPLKALSLLTVFTRPSVFAAAIAIVAVFAFVSSASAAEQKFDALGGVTAEVLTPAAMDAIQGMGTIHRHFEGTTLSGNAIHEERFTRQIGGMMDITINNWKGPTNFRVTVTKTDSAP